MLRGMFYRLEEWAVSDLKADKECMQKDIKSVNKFTAAINSSG